MFKNNKAVDVAPFCLERLQIEPHDDSRQQPVLC